MKIDLQFKDLPPMLRDNDKSLADTLSRGPFVLGYMFVFADELRTQSTGKMFLYIDDREIPLDDRGNFLINSRGPKNAFPSFSRQVDGTGKRV